MISLCIILFARNRNQTVLIGKFTFSGLLTEEIQRIENTFINEFNECRLFETVRIEDTIKDFNTAWDQCKTDECFRVIADSLSIPFYITGNIVSIEIPDISGGALAQRNSMFEVTFTMFETATGKVLESNIRMVETVEKIIKDAPSIVGQFCNRDASWRKVKD